MLELLITFVALFLLFSYGFVFAFKYIGIRFLIPHPCPVCGKHLGPLHEHGDE